MNNVRTWLVQLYPRAWRERYGEEFEALLSECLHSPLDILDIFLGALDAHLGFPYEINWRLMNMVNKLRTAALLVFVGYIGFVIGGLSLIGLVDDSPAADLMKSGNTALSSVWMTIAVASLVALLAVVAGGLPLAITLIRRAFTSSRRTLRLLLVPVYSFLALVLYGSFMASVGLGRIHIPGVAQIVSPQSFPLGNKLMLGGFMLVFVLGAIASVIAVWKAVTGLDEPSDLTTGRRMNSPRIFRYAFALAGVTSLAMVVMLAGTLAFGWLAHTAVPNWFTSNLGLLLSNTSASFAVTVLIMIISTAVAIFGLAHGRSAWKMA
jgi:hypothetical protein